VRAITYFAKAGFFVCLPPLALFLGRGVSSLLPPKSSKCRPVGPHWSFEPMKTPITP
jgi:hypothetical protein